MVKAKIIAAQLIGLPRARLSNKMMMFSPESLRIIKA